MTGVQTCALPIWAEDWFEADEWSEAAAQALRFVSVGIEHLAGGDPGEAGRVAGLATPVELFRAGVEVIRPAHLLARRVIADIGGTAGLRRFEEAAATTVEALASFPPQVADEKPPHLPRDPRSTGEVAQAYRTCLEAEAVARFAMQALGFAPRAAAPGTGPTFAAVVATAWAHGVLHGAPALVPLTGDEIGRAHV